MATLEFDAVDPRSLATFWSRILRREVSPDGITLPGVTEPDFAIRFVSTVAPPTQLHRMHFDLTSSSGDDQRDTVATALDLGARHLDVGQRGDEGHVVLADPEGNEFCVIEPGNSFLADTARIGALAGDGRRATGFLWHQALDWPLVWDEGEETAIQSPAGGTKLTWGGPPIRPKHGRNRLRWVLQTDETLADEVARLTTLGATILTSTPQSAELTDPDDNEFLVTA